MFPDRAPCFVLGGRYGDSIQLLPCFKAIFDRSGFKPVVICSHSYGSVYDGVSYVQAQPIRADWWSGIPAMKRIASECYGDGIVVQFWQEPPKHDDTIGFQGRNWTTLQSHGHAHGVDTNLDPNYGTSMARRCGFTQAEWCKLPLVFDRRNAGREAELVKRWMPRHPPKPVVLYNFTGISSPFAFAPEVVNTMLKFNRDFQFVDLGRVVAHRIYDLVGLMEQAVGMLHSDTATLHLSLAAPSVPYVAFTVDSWCASVPKGNCVLHIGYNSTPQRLHEVAAVLERWKAKA